MFCQRFVGPDLALKVMSRRQKSSLARKELSTKRGNCLENRAATVTKMNVTDCFKITLIGIKLFNRADLERNLILLYFFLFEF